MLLIGITGAKGSGKGTVAQYVADWASELGLLVVERGFADKLKWAMARLFWPDISMQDAINWANEFKNDSAAYVELVSSNTVGEPDEDPVDCRITGRQLFQHGGTEMGRKIFGEMFWVDQILPLGDIFLESHPHITVPVWWESFLATGDKNGAIPSIGTISDLRFENEALRIKELNGEIWQVVRPGFEPDGHDSEIPIPPRHVDSIVVNDSGLHDLRVDVFDLCDKLYRRRLIS